jgi:hypothetical protein
MPSIGLYTSRTPIPTSACLRRLNCLLCASSLLIPQVVLRNKADWRVATFRDEYYTRGKVASASALRHLSPLMTRAQRLTILSILNEVSLRPTTPHPVMLEVAKTYLAIADTFETPPAPQQFRMAGSLLLISVALAVAFASFSVLLCSFFWYFSLVFLLLICSA